MADNKREVLAHLLFLAEQDPYALADYMLENLSGVKGDPGDPGAAGKDAPTIQSITINVADGTISGEATMSEGEPVTITGTFSQA